MSVPARPSLTAARREAIAAQAIDTFLRELYKCGGSITFGGVGAFESSRLPEGVTATEMVERLKSVASAEV